MRAIMLVNRDPDGRPEATQAMVRIAREMRQHVVQVICDEADAKVGDFVGISFFAVVPFLPRAGDHIRLENGRHCEVKRAYYKVVKAPGDDGQAEAILLVPTVLAFLVEDGK